MWRQPGIFHWLVFVGQIIHQYSVNHLDVLSQIFLMDVLKCYEKVPCAIMPVLSCPKGILYTELFLLGNVPKSLETKYEDKNLQNASAALA